MTTFEKTMQGDSDDYTEDERHIIGELQIFLFFNHLKNTKQGLVVFFPEKLFGF